MSTCIFTQLLRTSSKNTNMALLFTSHLHVLGWMSSHGLSAVDKLVVSLLSWTFGWLATVGGGRPEEQGQSGWGMQSRWVELADWPVG